MKQLLIFSTFFLLLAFTSQLSIKPDYKINYSRIFNFTKICPKDYYRLPNGKCIRKYHSILPPKHFPFNNATNCTKGKILKCHKASNKTFCYCKKIIKAKPINITRLIPKCKKGTQLRCNSKNNTKCTCQKILPIIKPENTTELQCKDGLVKKCYTEKNGKRHCFCKMLFPVKHLNN